MLVLLNSLRGFRIYMQSSTGLPLPGLLIAARLAKDSASFQAVAPLITDLGSGWYSVAPIAAHRDTLGMNHWEFSAPTAVTYPQREQVVAFDPYDAAGLGLTRIDQRISDPSTLTPAERTAVANEVESQIINESDAEKVLEAIVNKINAMTDLDALTLSAIRTAIRTELAVELGRIDRPISENLAATAYTAPNNTGIQTLLDRASELRLAKLDQVALVGSAMTLAANSVNASAISSDGASEIAAAATGVDYDLIASKVYQFLRGASSVLRRVPTPGDMLSLPHNVDFNLDIPCASTVGATIIFTIGCGKTAHLVATSAAGLTLLDGVNTPEAADATVSRVDSTTVRIYIRARSLAKLAIGQHDIDLRETIGTLTNPLHSSAVELLQSPGS